MVLAFIGMLSLASARAGSHHSTTSRGVWCTEVGRVLEQWYPQLQLLCGDRTSWRPGKRRTASFHKHLLAGVSHQKLAVWLTVSSKFLPPAEKAFQGTRCTITIPTGAKQKVSDFLEQCASWQSQNSAHSQKYFFLKVCQMVKPHVLP